MENPSDTALFLMSVSSLSMFLLLLWNVTPDDKKFGLRLRLGLSKLNIKLDLGGARSGAGKVIGFLLLTNKGETPPHPLYLETWEPSKRWAIVFEGLSKMRRVGCKGPHGPYNSADSQRYNRYILETAEHNAMIGRVELNTGYENSRSRKEYITYRFYCGGAPIHDYQHLDIP